MNFPHGWELPESIRERVGERSGKQRAMIEDGHLLLILHKLPHPDQATREGALFWRDDKGEWKSGSGNAALGSLKLHLEAYAKEIDALDDRLERAQNATELFRVLEAITPIHRAAKNQHAALQAARDGLPDAHEIISFRDTAGDIDRNSELLEIEARNALEFHIARQTEEQNRLTLEMTKTAHQLNILAALFLPLTAITSIFGMNIPSGLERSPTWLYWLVLVFSLALGFVLRGMLNKPNK